MASRDEFVAAFPPLVKQLLDELSSNFEMPAYAVHWIETLLNHSAVGGKMTRGLTVISTLEQLVGTLSAELKHKAVVLGWCIELLQAYFLIADDLMDQSVTRRGAPCWYRMPRPIEGSLEQDKVGTIAVNDSFIVFSCLFRLLKHHFRTETYYVDLLELFNEVTYQTELGQLLDLTSQPSSHKIDISLFNIELYKKIVKYKTAFYSFYLPVALAMTMSGHANQETLAVALPILLEMGEYFQIQDDYLDCYGDPKVIGKIGRDIEENKCGWLIVQAMNYCSKEQLAQLEQYYGRDNPEAVAVVKAIYKDLDLEAKFRAYEDESFAKISAMIETADARIPRTVFTNLLAKIYKRNL